VMKLMMAGYEVTMQDTLTEFTVKLKGPAGSPYEGGVWKCRVVLPENYPYKSPSIGFCNRIYHPNVDEASGSVCLDVINQTWSPMFDLVNIFDTFLPQLLLYPNPTDPLNGEAASMLMRRPDDYKKKVQDYVKRFAPDDAPPPAAAAMEDGGGAAGKADAASADSLSEMGSVHSFHEDEDEAGMAADMDL